MKKLFLTLCLLFMCATARATTITVSSTTVPGWQYGSPATLRVFTNQNQTFTDTDGITHLAQASGGSNFYQSISCTAVSSTLTIPSFTIASTTDSPDNPNATYSFIFYDKNGVRRDTWAASYQIPVILGTTVTWARLRTFMAGHPNPPRPGFPDQQQVQALINAVLPAPKATDVIAGLTKISDPAADASNPIAMGVKATGSGTLAGATATTILSSLASASSPISAVSTSSGITGRLYIINIVPGVSFDVVSENGADAGSFRWWIF